MQFMREQKSQSTAFRSFVTFGFCEAVFPGAGRYRVLRFLPF
jgi:hypothetical protein